jgi:mRNA-degrading endonuclease RelE of RelBE toxin-antitoxin system
MKFTELSEFTKDVKVLSKRFRSLPKDIEVVQQILLFFPTERPPFSYRLNGLKTTTCIVKVKKMACQSIKGKGVQSGLRLIYAYFLEEVCITLIEVYHKTDKLSENRMRIQENFQ